VSSSARSTGTDESVSRTLPAVWRYSGSLRPARRISSSDARVASEARRTQRIADGSDAGEPTGTLDLDAVVEDVDADVVARHAVGPVDDRVDQPLQPGVLRYQADLGEPPLGIEGPPRWLQRLHLGPGFL
jgi:hypothetical protein